MLTSFYREDLPNTSSKRLCASHAGNASNGIERVLKYISSYFDHSL
jgi:hypothetical protein